MTRAKAICSRSHEKQSSIFRFLFGGAIGRGRLKSGEDEVEDCEGDGRFDRDTNTSSKLSQEGEYGNGIAFLIDSAEKILCD